MREIKFKVFVKLNESGLEYYSDEEIKFIHSKIHEVITLSFKYGNLCIADEEGISVITIFKERCEVYELMQYNGLKDKKGVEIYEGDILKVDESRYDSRVKNRIYATREVIYNDGGFIISQSAQRIYEYSRIEVIGNIHSNPELLK